MNNVNRLEGTLCNSLLSPHMGAPFEKAKDFAPLQQHIRSGHMEERLYTKLRDNVVGAHALFSGSASPH